MAKTALGIHGQLRARSGAQRAAVLDAARAMLDKGTGTDLVWREDLFWSDVQPTEAGGYDWTIPDGIVAAAADKGFRVWMVVSHPPAWATAPGGDDEDAWPCAPYPGLLTAGGQSALDEYVAVCAAAAARYSRGGAFWDTYSGTPRPVTHFEVWNEEYTTLGSKRWNGSAAVDSFSDPEAYAAIFNAAAPAIAASLFATPVAALCDKTWNSFPVGGSYLAAFLSHLNVPMPAVSLHPYPEGYAPPSTAPPSTADRWKYFTQVSTVRTQLMANGYDATRIWITEIGWPGATSGYLTEAQQAERFVDLWSVVQNLGYVRGLFLFTSTNPDFPDNTGLPGYNPGTAETWLPLWRTGVDAATLGAAKPAVAAITALPALIVRSSSGPGSVVPPVGPCVLETHFSNIGGVIAPQPWMQWRRVGHDLAASKSGSYAVAGGGNKNDLLQTLTVSWKNNSPLPQLVYGLVTRGGAKMALQARSRAYLQQLDGLVSGVIAPPAIALPVPTNALVEASRFGVGLDVGMGGVLTTQTGFGIIEQRQNSRTRPLMPHLPGWAEIAPGMTITARVDVRFVSEYWENWLAPDGVDGSEATYITGDTLLELYAVPKL